MYRKSISAARNQEGGSAGEVGPQPIPRRTDRQRHDRGRPTGFDRETYRRRNLVRRCFNGLRGVQGITVRHDRTAAPYGAAVTFASFPPGRDPVEDGAR
jgi:transposase